MDLSNILQQHINKLWILASLAAVLNIVIFFVHATFHQNRRRSMDDLPTVEEIQKYIESIPGEFSLEEIESLSLADLLDELEKLSDNEDWKNLLASVVND